MSSLATLDRWQRLCSDSGLSDPQQRTFKRLMRHWRGWGRHYHSLRHLHACLHEFDAVHGLAQCPAEVELALWFHDAIYRTYRTDNEQRSAAWARQFIQSQDHPSISADRVSDLILATRHHANPVSGDAALVVDIDLSILGQPADLYAHFERAVRREYWWVSRRRFNDARRQILLGFLERTALYHFEAFNARYAASAQRNLAWALRQMRIR